MRKAFVQNWKTIVRSGEWATILALVAWAFTESDEVAFMINLLAMAWLVSVISIVTYEDLDTTVVTWGISIITPMRVRLASLLGFGLLFSLIGLFINGHVAAKQAAEKATVPEVLFGAQLRELNELEGFIGQQSEDVLREMFDYPNMLKFNIALTKKGLAPQLMSIIELRDLDSFNQHAKGMVSLQYGRLIGHPQPEPLEVVPDEGQIVIINISDKYISQKSKLSKFKQSVNLPLAVINAVGELDDTLHTDTQLIMDVLNQDLREDKNYVIFDDSASSPYHRSTSGRYWTRFTSLQPKADKIVVAIRAYLKTD
jgi:hypothetical protein